MTNFGCMLNSISNLLNCYMFANPFMLGAINGYNSSMFYSMLSNPSIFMPQNYQTNNYQEQNYQEQLPIQNFNFNMPSQNLVPQYIPNNYTLPTIPQQQFTNNYSYIPQYEYGSQIPSPYDFTYGDIFGPPCTTGYSNWDTVFNNFISQKSKHDSNIRDNDGLGGIANISYEQNVSQNIDANKLDSRLGKGFTQKVKQIAKEINCDWEDLLGVMQAESGLNPKAWNGNSAVGLIQFTQVAISSLNKTYGLNLTKEKIANMSAVEQLDYVEKYLKMTKNQQFPNNKKLSSGDLYALVFLPGRAGKETLTTSSERYYAYNKGLDLDHDHTISKQDLINQVNRKKLEIYA